MNETVESGAKSVLDALTRAGLTDAATLVLVGIWRSRHHERAQ